MGSCSERLCERAVDLSNLGFICPSSGYQISIREFRIRITVSDAVTSECGFGECTRSWSGLRRRVVKQREEGPARPRASRADDDGPDTRPLQMSWQEGYDAKMLFNLQ
jgi:hypothetical protein